MCFCTNVLTFGCTFSLCPLPTAQKTSCPPSLDPSISPSCSRLLLVSCLQGFLLTHIKLYTRLWNAQWAVNEKLILLSPLYFLFCLVFISSPHRTSPTAFLSLFLLNNTLFLLFARAIDAKEVALSPICILQMFVRCLFCMNG